VALDGLVVDLAERRASVAGVALDLPPTELRVLDVLVRAAGRLSSREDLARRAFGPDWDGAPRAIDAYVARLRKKLAKANAGAPRITTVFGGGYRLERAARSPR
jgi:DNA-binding response OmpR family regulator